MQEKAANVGFDWPEWKLAWEKLDEELQEFRQALENRDQDELADEFGDVLFSLVNVSRYFELNAEDSLRKTNNKFEHRFRYIEEKLKQNEKALKDATLEEMDQYWNEAKAK